MGMESIFLFNLGTLDYRWKWTTIPYQNLSFTVCVAEFRCVISRICCSIKWSNNGKVIHQKKQNKTQQEQLTFVDDETMTWCVIVTPQNTCENLDWSCLQLKMVYPTVSLIGETEAKTTNPKEVNAYIWTLLYYFIVLI